MTFFFLTFINKANTNNNRIKRLGVSDLLNFARRGSPLRARFSRKLLHFDFPHASQTFGLAQGGSPLRARFSRKLLHFDFPHASQTFGLAQGGSPLRARFSRKLLHFDFPHASQTFGLLSSKKIHQAGPGVFIARRGSRTPTGLLPGDFKSPVSTIPPSEHKNARILQRDLG